MFYHCAEFSGDESPERKVEVAAGGDESPERKEEGKGLSVAVAAGIAVVFSLLVILPVGVALGCCGMLCLVKKTAGQEKPQNIYDVPDLTETALTENILLLSDNQAYGCATYSRK